MSVFIWPARVYYEDTDAGGVVYHANYLKFMERARTEMLRARGIDQGRLREEVGLIFAVTRLELDYLAPARFNDALEISAEVTAANRLRIDFQQQVSRARDKKQEQGRWVSATEEAALFCRAGVTVVALDAQTLRPKRMSTQLLEEMTG